MLHIYELIHVWLYSSMPANVWQWTRETAVRTPHAYIPIYTAPHEQRRKTDKACALLLLVQWAMWASLCVSHSPAAVLMRIFLLVSWKCNCVFKHHICRNQSCLGWVVLIKTPRLIMVRLYCSIYIYLPISVYLLLKYIKSCMNYIIV